jgi:hypothetical protein
VLQAADPVGEHDVQVQLQAEVRSCRVPLRLECPVERRPTDAERWRPLRSRHGDDPAVTVVMTVHSSEGMVPINYQTVTAAELAAARRAGSPT